MPLSPHLGAQFSRWLVCPRLWNRGAHPLSWLDPASKDPMQVPLNSQVQLFPRLQKEGALLPAYSVLSQCCMEETHTFPVCHTKG